MGKELASAAEEALRRWEEAAPHIDGAITMATVHGCPYRGPNVGEAMDALRDALARSRTITKEQVEEAARCIGDTYERFGQRGDLRAIRPSDAMLAALALAAAKAFGLTVDD